VGQAADSRADPPREVEPMGQLRFGSLTHPTMERTTSDAIQLSTMRENLPSR